MTAPDLSASLAPVDLAGLDQVVQRELRDYPTGAPPTRLVGVDTADAVGALGRLYALRQLGHVPLVGPWRDLPRQQEPGSDSAGLAVLTSGSTGRPRAVVRSWASWRDSFAAFGDVTGIGAGDVVLVPGPVSSSLFLFAAVHALESGARAILTSAWRPAAAAAALPHATAVHLTPSMLTSLLHHAATSLAGRKVVCAGARLPAGLAQQARAAGASLTHYYGAAELSFVAAGTHEDDLRPFPGVEVDVRHGEIWVRSGYLADGYLGAAGPLRGRAGGWVTVGDLGRLLPDARLRVDGRGDQLVVTGGVSVPVDDVEAALRTVLPYPEGVVIGLPHEGLGEVVAAVFEDDPGGLPGRATLRRCAAELLQPAHLPRIWLVVDGLPRTDAGKVARARLRSGLHEGTLAARPLR